MMIYRTRSNQRQARADQTRDAHVGGVEEGHHRTERRNVAILAFHLGETRLDVSCEGDVSRSPAVRDRNEDTGEAPGGADVLADDRNEGHDPDQAASGVSGLCCDKDLIEGGG